MGLIVTPLGAACGAEISGVDLSQPLAAGTRDAIYRAWLDHVVLVFHGQDMSEEAQRRFAGIFGNVAERARPVERRPEGSDYDGRFMLVTNVRDEKGNPIGSLPDGEMWFHHDMSYVPEPHKATFLYAMKVPSRGGNTCFANMYRACDKVPAEMKQLLAGRRALHVYDYGTVGRIDPDTADLSRIRHQWQPVFVANPETGRAALYVNRLMTARIEGLPRGESDAILERLFAIVEDRAIVYEHVWRPGDLVMWDNRCSCHARTDFPADEVRMLRRCTVEGGPVIAAAA
jgi:taurine dioxygenase